jgi:hypothetical protein
LYGNLYLPYPRILHRSQRARHIAHIPRLYHKLGLAVPWWSRAHLVSRAGIRLVLARRVVGHSRLTLYRLRLRILLGHRLWSRLHWVVVPRVPVSLRRWRMLVIAIAQRGPLVSRIHCAWYPQWYQGVNECARFRRMACGEDASMSRSRCST